MQDQGPGVLSPLHQGRRTRGPFSFHAPECIQAVQLISAPARSSGNISARKHLWPQRMSSARRSSYSPPTH